MNQYVQITSSIFINLHPNKGVHSDSWNVLLKILESLCSLKTQTLYQACFLEATIDLQVNLLPAGDELEDDSLIKALLEHVERQDSSSSPRPAQTTVNQFRSFADVTTRGIIFFNLI